MKYLVALFLTLSGLALSAAELKGVKMPDEVTVDGKKLVLNGMGLRIGHKWGFSANVYVAGLYVENKSKDSDVILKNDEMKYLVMHFVRPLDRDTLLEGYSTGYENGCFVECDKKYDQLGKLKPNVVSVRKDNEIKITFYKDKVIFDTDGPNAKKATIEDAALSRNLLSVYINKKSPPNPELRDGLLGL